MNIRGFGRRIWNGWLRAFRDPVVTDRSIDLMAAAYWFGFAAWGILSVLVGIPTVERATSFAYQVWWGASIATLALVAAFAAGWTFFPTTDVRLRIRKKLLEMGAVFVLAGFLTVYPVFLITAAIQGDRARIAVIALALQYLIVPAWRVRLLFIRIRTLRTIEEAADSGGVVP